MLVSCEVWAVRSLCMSMFCSLDIDRDMDLTANTSELNNIITETHIQNPNMRFDFCGQSPH